MSRKGVDDCGGNSVTIRPGCAYSGSRPGTRHLVGRDAGIRRLVSLHRRPSGRRCCFSPQAKNSTKSDGRLSGMASLEGAQLSSIVDTVADSVTRVADLGERLDGSGSSDAANALFEAERALRMASRALARAGRALDG